MGRECSKDAGRGFGGAQRAVARRARWLLGALALLALVLVVGSGEAAGQYISFGKNKVSYRQFDWRVLHSTHFDLYYYPEEVALAQDALSVAEEAYRTHRARFVHEMSGRIPIILYSSHHDFEQTNVTPFLIPEGVAGLTETMRGRVLMPFSGSRPQFERTLRHELVHTFQLSVTERVFRERFRRRMPAPPLWFTEGLADHWSGSWDADGDMVMRDLVLSGRVPEIRAFGRYNGTFTLYKLGESLLEYVGQTYGEDRLVHFYTDAWKARSFAELFPTVLGVTEEELSRGWTQWLRRRYYPEVLDGEPVFSAARRVSEGSAELKPTPVPEGIAGWEGDYVYVSPRSGYVNLYAAPLEGGGGPRVLVKGQRSAAYLSFHGYRSRLDVSRDGVLVFSSHAGERDRLSAYDLRAQRVVASWDYAELVGMTSPQWDARGERIVFSGLRRDGARDLYLLDARSGALTRLTADAACDTEPAFHPDGERIVFVSDRGAQRTRKLYMLEIATGRIWRLTDGPGWDLSPSWSSDGERLLFVSTRDGMRDLYVLGREGRGARLTRTLEALLDPRWLPGEKAVLATVYQEERFVTARIPVGPVAAADSFRAPVVLVAPGAAAMPAESLAFEHAGYRSSFALDAAVGGVAVDPGLGSGEGLQVLLRDLMGNRLIFFQLGNTTISTRDFLDNFSAGITYVDLSHRLNRGLSVFHHAGNYYDELGLPFFERRVGASGLLSYPLSRFTRLESSFGLAYAEKEKPTRDFVRQGVIATHYVSWIHDTALWTTTGPIDGERAHVTLGLTMNLRRPGVENVLLLADGRRYLRLGRQAALALRLQARASGGPDPQVFLLGGSHSLRGYEWRELHGRRALLANAELRFPLLRWLLFDPLWIGPLAFPGIQGALFMDLGQAWDHDWPERWQGSYGIGFRMGLGGFLVLRLDIARRTDFHDWPRGSDTEFFIGWNY